MEINLVNLQRMADHIKTIQQEMFDMDVYRSGQEKYAECDSVGCIIGHCTVLDKENLPINSFGKIMFGCWIEQFTGVCCQSSTSLEFRWLFSTDWSFIDNTAIGAYKRIEWYINHGVPKNWYNQMYNGSKLCYK